MKKIISLVLSFLLLLSSSGISYAQHFCGDHEMMAEFTLGEKHLSCGMVMPATACDSEEEKEHDCCDNEYTSVETDDAFAKVSFNYDFQVDWDILTAQLVEFIEVGPVSSTQVLYFQYRPPPPKVPLWQLNESFLI